MYRYEKGNLAVFLASEARALTLLSRYTLLPEDFMIIKLERARIELEFLV